MELNIEFFDEKRRRLSRMYCVPAVALESAGCKAVKDLKQVFLGLVLDDEDIPQVKFATMLLTKGFLVFTIVHICRI